MSTYSYRRTGPTPAHGWVIMRDNDRAGILALPPDTPELVVGAITAAIQIETDLTDAPEPDLREHCREFHPRIVLRGQADATVARKHGGEHHQYGSQSHHHGPNAGPHARPRGWRDGSGVVLIDRKAAMRRRNEGTS
jgi:hypothetical protein